jgi:NAD(P)-dependent dehydrogenase (short-subunit alcohol dehydrogenase family)
MSVQEKPTTVLITGGTDGLGRACAEMLAAEGYRVFAAGRSAEKRAQLDALARERKLPIETLEMDVCDEASVDRALAAMRASPASGGEPLGVLINNAGIGAYAPAEEITMDDLRRVMETNFFAIARLTQKILPEMRAARRGRILNMSSLAGRIAIPMFGAYCASKYALEGWSDALRLEVYPFGIDVVLIEPGVIKTNFQATARDLSGEYWKETSASPYAGIYETYNRQRKIADKRATDTPEDCARVVLRAIRETRPRPRYTVTRQAHLVTLLKKFLSDRMVDARLRRAFGLKRG